MIARTEDEATHYAILDEVQEVYSIVNPELTGGIHRKAKDGDEDIVSFADVVLALSRRRNIDVYVTGSNSRMLSTDIVTKDPLPKSKTANGYEIIGITEFLLSIE